MGEVKLSGLGYDTKPSYENNLKGLNAGYLNYSKIYFKANPFYQIGPDLPIKCFSRTGKYPTERKSDHMFQIVLLGILNIIVDIVLMLFSERHINLTILATRMLILNSMIYILKTTNRLPKLNFSSAWAETARHAC